MSATTVRLLQAAAEIAGGDRALARRLGISETLLGKLMSDTLELPDPLLLRAVDVILENRQPLVGARPTETPTANLQNGGDGICAASGTER